MPAFRAFIVHPADNVATLIDDVPAGATVECLGDVPRSVVAEAAVARGHKLALTPIASGAAVVKFGVRIGHATAAIAPGAWVHLHNLASDLDERSATLDRESGAPTDTDSAYV
jgi:hypothetical protein